MSTISAGTTSTSALVQTGDTTGQLVFQTNGTPPEVIVIEQPPAPTKEELLAQLQALSDQINALG
jgi:hypothetical protein